MGIYQQIRHAQRCYSVQHSYSIAIYLKKSGITYQSTKSIIEKQIKFYVIDAYKVVTTTWASHQYHHANMLFAISTSFQEKALELIKNTSPKACKKGEQIVKMNHLVDNSVCKTYTK